MEGAEALHTRERGKGHFLSRNSGAIRYFRSRERKWKKRVEIVARPWMLQSHWPIIWAVLLRLHAGIFGAHFYYCRGQFSTRGREKRRRRCSNALDPDWCPPPQQTQQPAIFFLPLFILFRYILCGRELERKAKRQGLFGWIWIVGTSSSSPSLP